MNIAKRNPKKFSTREGLGKDEEIRICIIGCGAISELYYGPALAELSLTGAIEVSALFDPDINRLTKLATLFPDAAKISDFDHILEGKPHAAIVASPPRFHASQTIALLAAGIAVLCEKPMAATVIEANAMIATAENSDLPLSIGLFRRFFPVSQMIRDVVRNQSLGRVKSFEISEGGPFQWPAQSASFFQKSNSQGGVLADLGVHVLDLLIWWFGMPTEIAYEDDAMGGLEANCLIKLRFADDVHGTVRLSRDTQLQNRTFIECERGWMRCNAAASDKLEFGFPGSKYSIGGNLEINGLRGPRSVHSTPAATYHQSFTTQLVQFLAAVRGEETVFIPASEGLLSLQVIEYCYTNRKQMKMSWLSDCETVMAVSCAKSPLDGSAL
jgi:predicted dehydrogenase